MSIKSVRKAINKVQNDVDQNGLTRESLKAAMKAAIYGDTYSTSVTEGERHEVMYFALAGLRGMGDGCVHEAVKKHPEAQDLVDMLSAFLNLFSGDLFSDNFKALQDEMYQYGSQLKRPDAESVELLTYYLSDYGDDDVAAIHEILGFGTAETRYKEAKAYIGMEILTESEAILTEHKQEFLESLKADNPTSKWR